MNKNSVVLLKLIKNNGSLSLLLENGLTYSQIVVLLNKLEGENLVHYVDNKILLTQKGNEYLSEYHKKYTKSNILILPRYKKRRTPLSFKRIYLPKHI